MVEIQIYQDYIHVKNSYEVKKTSEMDDIIKSIRNNADKKNSEALKRSDKSLKREWRAHNLLYDLGIFTIHTADVDLDINQKWYFKVGYFILSCLYYIKNR